MQSYVVWAGVMVVAWAVATTAVHPTRAQQLEHGLTRADIERGGQMYLASCASCHGPDADAIAGSNLAAGTFRRGSTDQELVAVIRGGIPGTTMPPNNLTEADALRVLGYLRSLPAERLASKSAGLTGDPAAGQATFDAALECRTCHMVNGTGGFLGPDLSSMGLTRRAVELERALIDPSADIRNGNRTATIMRRDGSTVIGRLLNQDTYSLQLITTEGRLLSIQKDTAQRWEIPASSAMPSYAAKFTAQQIADIVSYLQTLRAPVPATQAGRGGRGGAPVGAPGGGPPGQVPAGRGTGTQP